MAYIAGPLSVGNATTGTTGNNTHTSTQVEPGIDALGFAFVVEAAGATPTITFEVDGSLDGTNWYPITYLPSGSDTVSVAPQTVTATGTTTFFLDEPSGARFYKFYRVVTSANTNITYRCDYWVQNKA